jgi:hypothetical protein
VAQETSGKVETLEREKQEVHQQKETLEKQLAEWEGRTVEGLDINELRELKHRLKASLEIVGTALNTQKACPGKTGFFVGIFFS